MAAVRAVLAEAPSGVTYYLEHLESFRFREPGFKDRMGEWLRAEVPGCSRRSHPGAGGGGRPLRPGEPAAGRECRWSSSASPSPSRPFRPSRHDRRHVHPGHPRERPAREAPPSGTRTVALIAGRLAVRAAGLRDPGPRHPEAGDLAVLELCGLPMSETAPAGDGTATRLRRPLPLHVGRREGRLLRLRRGRGQPGAHREPTRLFALGDPLLYPGRPRRGRASTTTGRAGGRRGGPPRPSRRGIRRRSPPWPRTPTGWSSMPASSRAGAFPRPGVPVEAEVLFDEPTVWQRYRQWISAGWRRSSPRRVVIFGLLVERRRRREALKAAAEPRSCRTRLRTSTGWRRSASWPAPSRTSWASRSPRSRTTPTPPSPSSTAAGTPAGGSPRRGERHLRAMRAGRAGARPDAVLPPARGDGRGAPSPSPPWPTTPRASSAARQGSVPVAVKVENARRTSLP